MTIRLQVLFLFNIFWIFRCWTLDTKRAKVMEGVDVKSDSMQTINRDSETAPDEMLGPESTFFLNGHCFNSTLDSYDYIVCPFQNITQRRVAGTRGVVIGVWGHWNNASSQTYAQGDSCGPSMSRSTTLRLNCDCFDSPFRVSDVVETQTCQYTMNLDLPIPCNQLRVEYDEYMTQVKDTLVQSSTPNNQVTTAESASVSSVNIAESGIEEAQPNTSIEANAPKVTNEVSRSNAPKEISEDRHYGRNSEYELWNDVRYLGLDDVWDEKEGMTHNGVQRMQFMMERLMFMIESLQEEIHALSRAI